MVLESNATSADTESCSTYDNAINCRRNAAPETGRTRHASCSLAAAERAPPGCSPGAEWNSCGFLSRNSFSANRFFCMVTSKLSSTPRCCNPVGLLIKQLVSSWPTNFWPNDLTPAG